MALIVPVKDSIIQVEVEDVVSEVPRGAIIDRVIIVKVDILVHRYYNHIINIKYSK